MYDTDTDTIQQGITESLPRAAWRALAETFRQVGRDETLLEALDDRLDLRAETGAVLRLEGARPGGVARLDGVLWAPTRRAWQAYRAREPGGRGPRCPAELSFVRMARIPITALHPLDRRAARRCAATCVRDPRGIEYALLVTARGTHWTPREVEPDELYAMERALRAAAARAGGQVLTRTSI
jgi:hypothetical protein